MSAPQPPSWKDILEASIRTISMMAPSSYRDTIISSLIYELLDRYGLTKGDLRPILEDHDIEFPEQVVCETCNEYDEDVDADDEQQPHIYYEECPYCEKYYHNETYAHKHNLLCIGHEYKCKHQEDNDA